MAAAAEAVGSLEGAGATAGGGDGSSFSLAAVVSTVPAAAAFTLPDWALPSSGSFSSSSSRSSSSSSRGSASGGGSGGAGHSPTVLDVVYKPPLTALVRQAVAAALPVVPGATMLAEQGAEQSERWTGRTAPRRHMFRAVLENILKDYEASGGDEGMAKARAEERE